MVAITNQKYNLRGPICDAVSTQYRAMSDDDKEALLLGLVRSLSSRMTLRELKRWHSALYPPQLERARSGKE